MNISILGLAGHDAVPPALSSLKVGDKVANVKGRALAATMDVELREAVPLATSRDISSQVPSAHSIFKGEGILMKQRERTSTGLQKQKLPRSGHLKDVKSLRRTMFREMNGCHLFLSSMERNLLILCS